jgi:hypothetical protein
MFTREVRDRLLTNNLIQSALKLLDGKNFYLIVILDSIGIGQLNALIAFEASSCTIQEANIIDTNFRKLSFR